MRRPHLTCRVRRGLKIVADGGIPPLLRSPTQRRDAARATEWIEDIGKWFEKQKFRKLNNVLDRLLDPA